MRFRRSAVLLAVSGATIVSGCGGSSGGGSSSGDVSKAASSYIGALSRADGAAACKLMTTALQKQILQAANSSGSAALKGQSCPALVTKATSLPGGNKRNAGKKVTISKVMLTGNDATVSAGFAGQAGQQLKLQKVSGKWLISGM